REVERHRSAGLARRCPRPHQRSQYPKTRSASALELEDNLSQTRRMKRSSHSDLSCADFPAVLTVRLPSAARNGRKEPRPVSVPSDLCPKTQIIGHKNRAVLILSQV